MTSVRPPVRSDPRRLARARGGDSDMPSVRTSCHASPVVPAIKAAQTSKRFAEPSVAASGAVATPPTTRPITPPAAINGKKRFAWRVSATSPARPQTARMSVTWATFRTSQSAAYTQDAPASSMARLPSATTMMTGGNEQKCAGSSDARQESRDTESRREHRQPDQGVHERKLPDSISRKEQGIDGALGDHDSCIREKCDRHEEGDRTAFSAMKPKCGEDAL